MRLVTSTEIEELERIKTEQLTLLLVSLRWHYENNIGSNFRDLYMALLDDSVVYSINEDYLDFWFNDAKYELYLDEQEQIDGNIVLNLAWLFEDHQKSIETLRRLLAEYKLKEQENTSI